MMTGLDPVIGLGEGTTFLRRGVSSHYESRDSYRFILYVADRSFASPREDLPLPTQPPYTAYVANLSFDITEGELESFFGPHQVRILRLDVHDVM
jgi:hypothetical protein